MLRVKRGLQKLKSVRDGTRERPGLDDKVSSAPISYLLLKLAGSRSLEWSDGKFHGRMRIS